VKIFCVSINYESIADCIFTLLCLLFGGNTVQMLIAFKAMGVNMSLKIHFLRSHLDFFPPDLGKVTDEHGERFHETISTIEKRFMRRADERMMGEFCWLIEI
jgi:hypothetical protein